MSDEPSKQTPTSLSQAPWATLWGWGRSIRSRARLWRPESTEELHAGLVETKQPLIPRGAGRAYGDAALCRGGIVADTSRLRRVIDFDPKQGLLTTEAGVLLSDVVARFLPQGWFLPVTPGTLQVSIGGAIAADVHGKNHHLDGGFCSHVSEIELATPSGSLTTRPGEPEFAATAGGMGLVGVVAKATVRLIPIETAYVAQETRRFEDLEHLIGYLFDTDKRFRYSVAWVDLSWRGKKVGPGTAAKPHHPPPPHKNPSNPPPPTPRNRINPPPNHRLYTTLRQEIKIIPRIIRTIRKHPSHLHALHRTSNKPS